MNTAITQGIQVSVVTRFEPSHSNPQAKMFIFSYRIRIENKGENTVQLLRRHWIIYDSNGEIREVEGPGVVGETPTLKPGESYEYASACDLNSTMGSMEGEYMMENKDDEQFFQVVVPNFKMEVPWILN